MASDNDQAVIEEKEFTESWASMLYYFATVSSGKHSQWLKPLVTLMTQLRERDYDQKLLAAQSMTRFILRRQRGHRGLPIGKPELSIDMKEDGRIVIAYRGDDGETKIEPERLEYTLGLEALLKRLVAHPVDQVIL